MTEPVQFTHEMEVAWIAEHFDLARADCDAVLTVEWEYQVAVGIAVKLDEDTPDWEFRYYQPGELDGASQIVDDERIARDSERLAGAPYETALRVLKGEFEFFRLRGLINEDKP